MNNRSFGVLFLCAFLIVYGLLAITNITFALAAPVLALLAIAAGILLLLGR